MSKYKTKILPYTEIEMGVLFSKCALKFAWHWKLNGSFHFHVPEAEFKEFEPRLKYGWFHLKLY